MTQILKTDSHIEQANDTVFSFSSGSMMRLWSLWFWGPGCGFLSHWNTQDFIFWTFAPFPFPLELWAVSHYCCCTQVPQSVLSPLQPGTGSVLSSSGKLENGAFSAFFPHRDSRNNSCEVLLPELISANVHVYVEYLLAFPCTVWVKK